MFFLYLQLHVITERWHLTVNGVHNVWVVSSSVVYKMKRSIRTDFLLGKYQTQEKWTSVQTKPNNHRIGWSSLLL